eukprot:TRINITY_DN15687_c0_g1_i2.p2 TRINITY_DN15687_c0_g1~~TRINITY_DN15687_c0_g1_i2.p2  ORF type:complete len:242 (-),score=38.86 TRINITY_DN15687_c0_g1_i2:268-993(-)
MKRKLETNLGSTEEEQKIEWQIGQCIGIYYRTSFDTVLYPYLPAHVTKPKEVRKIFFVCLPEHCFFLIPKNLKLLAVPLFEIYDNVTRYGPIISAMPQMLSRLKINLVRSEIQYNDQEQLQQEVPQVQQTQQPAAEQGAELEETQQEIREEEVQQGDINQQENVQETQQNIGDQQETQTELPYETTQQEQVLQQAEEEEIQDKNPDLQEIMDQDEPNEEQVVQENQEEVVQQEEEQEDMEQ